MQAGGRCRGSQRLSIPTRIQALDRCPWPYIHPANGKSGVRLGYHHHVVLFPDREAVSVSSFCFETRWFPQHRAGQPPARFFKPCTDLYDCVFAQPARCAVLVPLAVRIRAKLINNGLRQWAAWEISPRSSPAEAPLHNHLRRGNGSASSRSR